MARIARVVVPSLPHHIIQRGNRRQRTFFSAHDYRVYMSLLADWCDRCAVEIWAYCLMPNHVHLIAVPESADGLRRAISEVHRRYTNQVNEREGWRGHLWQGRFASYVMDDRYTLAADQFRKHEGTGRPLGTDSFVRELEKTLGRSLKKRKPGRPGKRASAAECLLPAPSVAGRINQSTSN
jgi:REP element-mobilizing transposase RayT